MMTSRSGIGSIITTLAIAFIIGGCFAGACGYIVYAAYSSSLETDSTEHSKPLDGSHLPSQCAYLYNTDRSAEWFECMGVGYAKQQ